VDATSTVAPEVPTGNPSPRIIATYDNTDTRAPYEGTRFGAEVGTRWQMLQPLPKLKLQQDHSPYGARQVYAYICLDELGRKYGEANVKMKLK
jgi:hypothetical protein